MIETAVVFDSDGRPIHWHEPLGRTGGSLPDSRSLWAVIWENRKFICGVAHTHPWDGPASASQTDLTTFAAIELGLHKRFVWPVVTFTDIAYFIYAPEEGGYVRWHSPFDDETRWLETIEELRRRSRGE